MKLLQKIVPLFAVLAAFSFATPSAQARWFWHHSRVYVGGGYPYGYYGFPGTAYYGGPYYGYGYGYPYYYGGGFAFGGHGYYHGYRGGYSHGGYRGSSHGGHGGHR